MGTHRKEWKLAGTTTVEANKARLKNATPTEELAEEIIEFRDQWHLDIHALVDIFGLSDGTINSILYNRDRTLAEAKTVEKIRKGIREYNPRTCRHRKLPCSEVGPALRKIQRQHNLKVWQLAEILGITRVKCSSILIQKQKTVPVEDMRNMLVRYNKWLETRSKTLDREGIR